MPVCQSLEDLQLGLAEMEISHVPGGKKKARKLEMECIIPYCIGTDQCVERGFSALYFRL